MDAVIDTNVISYIFRGDSRAGYYRSFIAPKSFQVISFATLQELRLWTVKRGWSEGRLGELELFLKRFVVYHTDDDLCWRCARLIADRESQGLPLSLNDAWIAATALELGLPLVTHNSKDFERIAGLRVHTAPVP